MIEIEFEKPEITKCECCGNTSTRLTRFVYQDDDAFAVYYVRFTEGHEDKLAYSLIGLGEWGEEGTPELRTAFAVKIWSNDDNWNVSVTDKAESPWSDVDFLGKILDREEALEHSWVKDVFHITDHIVAEDQPVIDYFS